MLHQFNSIACDARHPQASAVSRSVCINLYDYFEKFFTAADRSFPAILDRCPNKTMSQVFQDFLTKFYSVDVNNLSAIMSNLLSLSEIGNEHEQVP